MLQIIKQFKRAQVGVDTWFEFFTYCLQSLIYKFTHYHYKFYENARLKRFRKVFFNKTEKNLYIKNIKLPVLDYENEKLFPQVFDDTFTSYYYFNDSYDEAVFDKCDKFLGEGIYGLVNNKIDVTVKSDDIVIDAGSWIGDFAAYASVKGAKVYAFEPTDETYNILSKTAKLNGNIIPVKKGLSNKNTNVSIFLSEDGSNSGANSLINKEFDENFVKAPNTVETIRLDDFVRENNLTHVDFIKADIEGFERYMLEGAQETLRKFSPKLALCTYHLPDDPEVLAALIKKANPAYNIVQKRKKLFASVPK